MNIRLTFVGTQSAADGDPPSEPRWPEARPTEARVWAAIRVPLQIGSIISSAVGRERLAAAIDATVMVGDGAAIWLEARRQRTK
jgi:hypothetical protein